MFLALVFNEFLYLFRLHTLQEQMCIFNCVKIAANSFTLAFWLSETIEVQNLHLQKFIKLKTK